MIRVFLEINRCRKILEEKIGWVNQNSEKIHLGRKEPKLEECGKKWFKNNLMDLDFLWQKIAVSPSLEPGVEKMQAS